MKVFMCKRCGCYSGGLAVVAANSKEEAYIVFHSDERYKYFLNNMDETTEYGEYTDDPLKCDSDYYRKADWFEVPNLVANVETPCVIEQSGYTE